MTIVEALRISKETGEAFMRKSGGGWVAWDEEWTYKFTADDMIADDWVTASEAVSTITGGKWEFVDVIK